MHNTLLEFAKQHGCTLLPTGKGKTTRILFRGQNLGYVNNTVLQRHACYGYRFRFGVPNDGVPIGDDQPRVLFRGRYSDLPGQDWHNGTGSNRSRKFLCIADINSAKRVLLKDIADLIRQSGMESPGVRDLAKPKPTMLVRLPDEEGERDGLSDDASYTPQEGDQRQVVERQIRQRRGQQQFRDALRKRYGDRCAVTGCEVLALLEAAHINPYRGENDNHPENGLLLRADIHTLFDLDLLGIEPDRLRVELHPDLAKEKEYGHLAGNSIGSVRDQRPSQEALRLRYKQFQKLVHRPV